MLGIAVCTKSHSNDLDVPCVNSPFFGHRRRSQTLKGSLLWNHRINSLGHSLRQHKNSYVKSSLRRPVLDQTNGGGALDLF